MVNKAGNFTLILDIDNPLLPLLINKVPINPGQVICEEFLRFQKSKTVKTPLPFAPLISFILCNNKIFWLDTDQNKEPPQCSLTTLKKMGLNPFGQTPSLTEPVIIVEEEQTQEGLEPGEIPDEEAQPQDPVEPVPPVPEPEAQVPAEGAPLPANMMDQLVERVSARVAEEMVLEHQAMEDRLLTRLVTALNDSVVKSVKESTMTIFNGYDAVVNMHKFLHNRLAGLEEVLRQSHQIPGTPLSPFAGYEAHQVSPIHYSPSQSHPSSPHPQTQTSPKSTPPPSKHSSPSKNPSPSSSDHPDSPPSPTHILTHASHPAPSQPSFPPDQPSLKPEIAHLYTRRGKAPVVTYSPTIDDAKKGEKIFSVPTLGESSQVQGKAVEAATILSSIASMSQVPEDVSMSQTLEEIHELAEAIKLSMAEEEVVVEDASDSESDAPINVLPANSADVLEQDLSMAMVVYEGETNPVSINLIPHYIRQAEELHEEVESFIQQSEQSQKEREDRDAARTEGAKSEPKDQVPYPVIPSWGVRKIYSYGEPVKPDQKDQIQTTSEFLKSDEEIGPEVQSKPKKQRIKMTAPKPKPKTIATRASTRASKGIVIEEPKVASKSAAKRKAAPKGKGKSVKPPPKKKQKFFSYKDSALAALEKIFPKASPKKKGPAKKKKEKIMIQSSPSSGEISSESGDYDLDTSNWREDTPSD